MKDPAFLFYPNDYLGGTMGMTFEEKGAYIELLMVQFNRGHMTSHMIGQTVGHVWDNIKDKFQQDENGLWYNERLDVEKFKRKKYTESRRNNLSGNNQYTKKGDDINGHMTSHMDNENRNENIGKGVQGKNQISYPSLDDVTAYFKEKGYKTETAKIAFEYYNASNWHDRDGKPVKNWKQKMISVWFKEEHKEPVKVNDRFKTPILL